MAVATVAMLATVGCQGRATSAQKLFDQGKYEDVIKRYPDLEIAHRARVKMADKLLEDKQYDVVITQYADTRAAYQARIELAKQAFNQGKYQFVIDSFPTTPVAKSAREKLADSLFQAGNFDQLIVKYPDTPQALQVKEKMSKEDLDKAKKLKGDAKKAALEEIMKKYSGTDAYKEATGMLSEIHQKESQKTQKK